MKDIVKEAYALFENYKVKSALDVCTYCCMDKKNEVLLANLPVKKISKNLLMEYNDGASSEKTPIEELKYFLPRYIELASDFEFPSHSIELTFRRLEPFKRDEWTDKEFDLLEKFALIFFNKCLSIYPHPDNELIDSILIMLWRGQFKLTGLLNKWVSNNSLSSILHYKDLYFYGFEQKNPSKMSNAFGEEDVSEILRDWMNKEDVRKVFKENIEEIIMNDIEMDESQSTQLNILYDILNRTQDNTA